MIIGLSRYILKFKTIKKFQALIAGRQVFWAREEERRGREAAILYTVG